MTELTNSDVVDLKKTSALGEGERGEGWGERGQGRRGGEERREAKRSPKPPSCHGDSLSERSSQS